MRVRHPSKGPWTKQFGAFTPGFASAMRIFSGKRAVADVFWGDNESEQNANLIAAAPEMLELVETLLSVTVNAVDPNGFSEIREKCYRVIAKARGES